VSHPEQLAFVSALQRIFPNDFKGARVLEIGSMDINGSVRSHFTDCDYVGVDVGEGAGVDHAEPGQLVGFPTASFDVAISCECFEHNPYWVETFANMLRMTKPGGLVIMSCAGNGRKEHGTARSEPGNSPATVEAGWNYYRNVSSADVRAAIPLHLWFSETYLGTSYRHYDTYFVGRLAGGDRNEAREFEEVRRSLQPLTDRFQSPRIAVSYLLDQVGGDAALQGVRSLRKFARGLVSSGR
tara:strand:+ start:625 stop:1347 length:723 start_codon:yes stop_codon:yes gene_type:complete